MIGALDFVSKVGPFIGGLALAAGAAVAWYTVSRVDRWGAEQKWVDSYREMYAEFWREPTMAEVRLWIVSEREYERVAKIIDARLPKSGRDEHGNDQRDIYAPNMLSSEDNEILESIDKFCSMMVRLEFFCGLPGATDSAHRIRWQNLYSRYWLARVAKRESMKAYIGAFWADLHEVLLRAEQEEVARRAAGRQ